MDLKDILVGVALGTAATVGYQNLDDETKEKINKALGNMGDDAKSKIKETTGIDLDDQVKSAKGTIDKTIQDHNLDDVFNSAKDTVSKTLGAAGDKASELLDKAAGESQDNKA